MTRSNLDFMFMMVLGKNLLKLTLHIFVMMLPLQSFFAQHLLAQSQRVFPAADDSRIQSGAPGESLFGKNDYVEYIVGSLPVVISVPHGGYEKPSEIPDRSLGTMGHLDSKTQELAREIVAEFRERAGKVPHVIINRLHRSKLDANRELFDAAQDDSIAGQAWNEFHSFIDSAEQRIGREFGRGLYIDLHGHRHEWQVVELGYLLVGNQLKLSNAELDASVQPSTTSLGLALNDRTAPLSQLVRGPRSYGAALEQEGIATVPSPAHPHPDGQPYFSGGYNLEQHSAFSGKLIVGVQVETPTSLRENDTRRKTFARGLVNGVLAFLSGIGF